MKGKSHRNCNLRKKDIRNYLKNFGSREYNEKERGRRKNLEKRKRKGRNVE